MATAKRARLRFGWLGAGALTVGIGAALAGGSGIAHADTADSAGGDSSRSAESRQTTTAARARGVATPAARTGGVPARVTKQTAPSAAAVATGVSLGSAARAPVVAAPAAPAAPVPRTYTAGSSLPARIQWNANYGYCGEVSFISAGLQYGQYVSQYDARAIASNNARQSLESSQLLLGVNDVATAKAMRLSATAFNTAQQPNSTAFLTWVKSNVTAGYPVVMGVFQNQSRFYGTRNLNAGDAEYDHIVIATGITSTRPLTGPATYYADDVVTFNDNGLWTKTPNGQPQNSFSYSFGSFATTRQRANALTGPVYSLKSGADYGIAITGIMDLNRETVPVRLTTSTNAETPVMINGSNTRPAAKPVTLTITVSNLKPGTTYTLYRYTSMANVPDSNFNANAAKAAQKWTITIATGTTYTMTQTINSNETAVYRAVPVGAR